MARVSQPETVLRQDFGDVPQTVEASHAPRELEGGHHAGSVALIAVSVNNAGVRGLASDEALKDEHEWIASAQPSIAPSIAWV